MKICDICGELKPCRKKARSLYSMGENMGKNMGMFFGIFSSSFDWVCEKCDKAERIIWNNGLKKLKEQDKIKQQEWIKHRNKLLKDNKIKLIN